MIKEALEYLVKLTQAGTTAQRLGLGEGEIDTQSFIINGQIQKVPVNPRPRDHDVETLEDLINAAERFAVANNLDEIPNPSIFYSQNGAILVIDDGGYRRNTVEFDLVRSNIFERFTQLNGQWLDQKSFLRMLKIDFKGALASPGLLEAVKSLKFENSATTTGVIDRSKESMGREFKSNVNSKGEELPEEITFAIPVYSNPGEREMYSVGCALETDAVAARLRYVILPDQLELIQQAALDSIRERLFDRLEDKAFIYQGRA